MSHRLLSQGCSERCVVALNRREHRRGSARKCRCRRHPANPFGTPSAQAISIGPGLPAARLTKDPAPVPRTVPARLLKAGPSVAVDQALLPLSTRRANRFQFSRMRVASARKRQHTRLGSRGSYLSKVRVLCGGSCTFLGPPFCGSAVRKMTRVYQSGSVCAE